MSKNLTTLFIFICLTQMTYADSWTQKADFPGLPVSQAVAFSVGNYGYVGTGSNSFLFSTKSFYRYDPAANTWIQAANFGGHKRISAVGFSIGQKGYCGLGIDSIGFVFSDFWEYEPVSNVWTQKANFPYAVTGETAFSVLGKGYVCGGLSQYFWMYDPIQNTWTSKSNYPGFNFTDGVGFSVDSLGYFGTGFDGTSCFKDFWCYDPTTDAWTQKANMPVKRRAAVGFSIGDFGYIGTGTLGFNGLNDFYKYNPDSNVWHVAATFPGTPRGYARGFSLNGKGYLGTSKGGGAAIDDWWEYTPDSTTGISDLEFTNYDLQVTPNPAKDFIKLTTNNNQLKPAAEKITIANVAGKIVYTSTIASNETVIDVKPFANGVYTVSVNDGKQVVVKKFLKE